MFLLLCPIEVFPIGQRYKPNNVGMAFSRGIVKVLLRNKLDFEGYVSFDTGIICERLWGLEDQSTEEQLVIAINAGTDVLSGFNDKDVILDLFERGGSPRNVLIPNPSATERAVRARIV